MFQKSIVNSQSLNFFILYSFETVTTAFYFMDAMQARQASLKNLKGPVIEPFLKVIYQQIEDATKEGRFSIIPSFSSPNTKLPTFEEREAVFTHLRSEGFTVKDHPNPDPGHPCSHEYTTVEW